MIYDILILVSFLLAAAVVYRLIDRLIDPLLPFTKGKEEVKKAVIVMDHDTRRSSDRPDSPAGNNESPISGNKNRTVGKGGSSDKHSLPLSA